MSGYNLRQIIGQIWEGSSINILTFKHSLSSQPRINSLKSKTIHTNSVPKLLTGLAGINPTKLALSLLLFSFKLATVIAGPFIINFIIQNILNPADSALPFTLLLLLTVLYKAVSSVIVILCNFVYSSMGFEYFAYLYWYLLNHYHRLLGSSGRKVNILEYDCNLLTNLPYSALTSLFYLLQITVLFGLLTMYLINTTPFSLFASLIGLYLLAQSLISLATFTSNRAYMTLKDHRLACNLRNDDPQAVLLAREQELQANRKFLLTKLGSKFISILFPVLLNIYVFLIADRSSFQDEQYTVLILINLIRNPIAELMMALNLNAEILNSCRRIVSLTKRQDSLEPFTEELTSNQMHPCEGLASHEKGNVALGVILKYFFAAIPFQHIFCLIFSCILLTGSRFYGYFVTQHIMARTCEFYHYIGLSAQLLTPILFYFALIASAHLVSSSLFHKLKKTLDYETLNRISGDIAAIDRTVTINLFEIIFTLALILSSYLYSIITLPLWWLQILLLLFLTACLSLAFKSNRFIMRSRREVARRELQMKAQMLRGLLEGKTLKHERGLRKNWRRIFQCKEMGVLIENFYMSLISLLLLILSITLIVVSQWLDLQHGPHSILLMACLTIDYDISSLCFAAVRLQLSLVSFQRVLNTLAP